LLAFWDELVRRHPGMPIDCCASGGGRNDLEMMRRSFPLLKSDYRFETNGTQGHTYGISSWIPYHGTGVYVDNAYQVRSHDCSWLGYGVHNPLDPKTDWAFFKRMVDDFRKVSIYLDGDYYPLSPYDLSDAVWMAWQFDCPERGEGMVEAFRHKQSIYESMRAKLRGLDPDATYTLTKLGCAETTEASGRELIERGLPIVINDQPGFVVIMYKKKS
jgi:alpha-galactosidase